MEIITSIKVFAGTLKRVRHFAQSTQCDMTFSIFLPQEKQVSDLPVLYWLSGLTCTDENFCQKSGAFQYAQKYGVVIVCPDTSPRGVEIPGQDDRYDLGAGAGFYVNATQSPWSKHYQMYDYVTEELPNLIDRHFPVSNLKSIMGHSMGGHGAIICALKNPELYRSVSAFAPILNPMSCPWGCNAFKNYLGNDPLLWSAYDATALLARSNVVLPMLIDQGTDDQFLKEQLLPDMFIKIAKEKGYPLNFRYQPGYDHSYYFISTFIEDHIKHHTNELVSV